MKRKIVKAVFSIVLFLACVTSTLGQVRQERDFNKSFQIPEDGKIEIINKYGEIIVRTWDSDSVRFDVLVRAEGRNSDVVNKSMQRVDIKFRKVGRVVSAVTEVSKGRGFFGNVASEVSGVMGSNKLKINYEVWLPEGVLLSVENKYGDVYLADMDAKVDIDVSHGDIKAGDISKSLNLKHSYGKTSFGKVESIIGTLRSSESYFEEVNSINIESGSSDIRIDKASKTQFNSRNDEIVLLDVFEVMCEGSFTDLTAELIRGSARLDFSYGDIYLSRIEKNFNTIDITGKSTDINLILNQASYIKTFIKGPEEKMILPNSMLLMKKELFDDGRISLSGDVGNTNTEHSQLVINAEDGELIIAIKETSLFSDRD
ncbi:MAG: hypothetical protein AAF391_01435 [Bacteroidota bacterium]